ncbi:MAG: homocysteine S-methyltransferase family protein [Dorea sp.]|nr:homocysteine S-methyltransferase family protein [Dorea sp.]
MTREELYNLCCEHPLILDGATGSNLQKAGMPSGVCPERWILDHPEALIGLQQDFIRSGTQILLAPTFSGNRLKLREYGLDDQIEEINSALVRLSKKAVSTYEHLEKPVFVAGDMTMTGESLAPMGRMTMPELIDIYKEQAAILCAAGVDLFFIETMMSLAETRAAVIAIREVCDLPIIASLTFNEDGRTLFGTDPETAIVVLQSLGASVVGINCSTGPDKMIEIVERMRKFANIPLMAKPNAGLPKFVDGKTVYDMTAEEFASYGPALIKSGAALVGGCCGTSPDHIRLLAEAVKELTPLAVDQTPHRVVASERKVCEIDINGPFLIIGERINPTGKKKLQASLREGSLELVNEMALQQEELGASILDINMGMNGINEKEMMLKAIDSVSLTTNLPLCIDSSHIDVIEEALRNYPGRALINSISLEKEKFEKLLPIAKKYGAMFILLPLSDAGIPKSLEEKKEIIHTILDRALELGMHKEDIIVDGLVTTVGANKMAALETLETISYCKHELGLATTCGLSNISFGLPNRANVNAAFATMAIQSGLTMAIANPSTELVMTLAFASDLLLAKPGSDLRYIDRMSMISQTTETLVKTTVTKPSGSKTVTTDVRAVGELSPSYQDVLRGRKNVIVENVKAELALTKEGSNEPLKTPSDIINLELIPAISKVGEFFEKKTYFLPQLISSAEAMKTAIEYLEPLLQSAENEGPKTTIVIATVEGDIHDIGKNLVALMLKNYGYRVIDLGKDVPKEKIVQTAIDENADFIALSALMTTTMMRMKDVVELVKEKGVKAKVMIGGAVITQSFADEIGADGYSTDAADAVKLVERLKTMK